MAARRQTLCAGEVAESSLSWSLGSWKRDTGPSLSIWNLAQPRDTLPATRKYLLQQSHATNNAAPCGPLGPFSLTIVTVLHFSLGLCIMNRHHGEEHLEQQSGSPYGKWRRGPGSSYRYSGCTLLPLCSLLSQLQTVCTTLMTQSPRNILRD